MFLHLGQSTMVRCSDIIGIFDLDNTTVMKSTREYLKTAEQNSNVFNVSYELPKSFVVCSENNRIMVYISQIAVSTLLKRLEESYKNIPKRNIN